MHDLAFATARAAHLGLAARCGTAALAGLARDVARHLDVLGRPPHGFGERHLQVDAQIGSACRAPAATTAEQVAEIKSTIQSQQKFLGELLEHGHRWELEGAELRIYFPTSARTYADMIEGRDSLEKIRNIASKVLGRPVRVCAKLESVAATAVSASRGSASQDLRDQFERDPVVKSMMQRFGGKITEVKRNQEES